MRCIVHWLSSLLLRQASPRNASYFDSTFRPNAITGNPGRTHRFYTGTPVYSFGDGLSYSRFGTSLLSEAVVTVPRTRLRSYAEAATVQNTFDRSGALPRRYGPVHTARISVVNHGPMAGGYAVLAFVKSPRAGHDGAPIRELAGFEKVSLVPGQYTTVCLEIYAHDLTLTRRGGGREVVEGNWHLQIGDTDTIITV